LQLAEQNYTQYLPSSKGNRQQVTGPEKEKEKGEKKKSVLQQGQAVILISAATWVPNIIVVIIITKMNVGEM